MLIDNEINNDNMMIIIGNNIYTLYMYTHIADHRNVPCLCNDRFGMTCIPLGSEKHCHLLAYHLRDRFGRVHRLAVRIIPFQHQRYVRQ